MFNSVIYRTNWLTRSPEMPPEPYSLQQAIHQAQLTLATGKRLLGELPDEEDLIRGGVREGISWVLFILLFIIGGITSFLSPLLPLVGTIMESAERVRQSQERLIEFQRQAVGRLDSHRDSVLEAIVGIRSPFVHGEFPPNGPLLARRMEVELSRQLELTISDLERRSQLIPEEIRRLRRIEEGQREGQGMDNRQLLEMMGRYAQEERDMLEANQAAGQSGEARNDCPTCIIL